MIPMRFANDDKTKSVPAVPPDSDYRATFLRDIEVVAR